MSDLLNRIETLLEKADLLSGTKDFDCEQELRDASNRIFALEQQLAKERESTKELISAIRSINKSKNHFIEKDDDEFFLQRCEWVEWILEMAKETESAINPPS